MVYILSRNPLFTSLIVERFELQASECPSPEFCIYSDGLLSLIDFPEHLELSLLSKDIFADADRVFVVSFAFGVSNERYIGDVLLPNAFLALHPELSVAEISEGNTDEFFYDSLFLTQYEDQKDYDFGKFSLSIGGICVTGNADVSEDAELLEKIRIAYEPDAYDNSSLELVRHLQELTGIEDIYVIQGLLTGEKTSNTPAENIERYVGENVINITKFLVDNFLEGDGLMTIDIH